MKWRKTLKITLVLAIILGSVLTKIILPMGLEIRGIIGDQHDKRIAAKLGLWLSGGRLWRFMWSRRIPPYLFD